MCLVIDIAEYGSPDKARPFAKKAKNVADLSSKRDKPTVSRFVWMALLKCSQGFTGYSKMADCELLDGCLFYDRKMPVDNTLWAHFVKQYCKGNYEKCGRYMVAKALGPERVPTDLYPNMDITASKIIQGVNYDS